MDLYASIYGTFCLKNNTKILFFPKKFKKTCYFWPALAGQGEGARAPLSPLWTPMLKVSSIFFTTLGEGLHCFHGGYASSYGEKIVDCDQPLLPNEYGYEHPLGLPHPNACFLIKNSSNTSPDVSLTFRVIYCQFHQHFTSGFLYESFACRFFVLSF